jgi:hypothetical protein
LLEKALFSAESGAGDGNQAHIRSLGSYVFRSKTLKLAAILAEFNPPVRLEIDANPPLVILCRQKQTLALLVAEPLALHC